MLECHHELSLFHIQFTTLLALLLLRSLNSVETLQGFIYISEETSSEHARSAPWGLVKMELGPSGVSDGSHQEAGSAAERGMEELRQRMDQQPES